MKQNAFKENVTWALVIGMFSFIGSKACDVVRSPKDAGMFQKDTSSRITGLAAPQSLVKGNYINIERRDSTYRLKFF